MFCALFCLVLLKDSRELTLWSERTKQRNGMKLSWALSECSPGDCEIHDNWCILTIFLFSLFLITRTHIFFCLFSGTRRKWAQQYFVVVFFPRKNFRNLHKAFRWFSLNLELAFSLFFLLFSWIKRCYLQWRLNGKVTQSGIIFWIIIHGNNNNDRLMDISRSCKQTWKVPFCIFHAKQPPKLLKWWIKIKCTAKL